MRRCEKSERCHIAPSMTSSAAPAARGLEPGRQPCHVGGVDQRAPVSRRRAARRASACRGHGEQARRRPSGAERERAARPDRRGRDGPAVRGGRRTRRSCRHGRRGVEGAAGPWWRPPAGRASDAAGGIAVGVREQHRVDRVEAAHLAHRSHGHVDEHRDRRSHERRALAAGASARLPGVPPLAPVPSRRMPDAAQPLTTPSGTSCATRRGEAGALDDVRRRARRPCRRTAPPRRARGWTGSARRCPAASSSRRSSAPVIWRRAPVRLMRRPAPWQVVPNERSIAPGGRRARSCSCPCCRG